MTFPEAMVWSTAICCGSPVLIVLILTVSSLFISKDFRDFTRHKDK